ncbi:hypothetical protein AVEN_170339-1 [Araneus ventricosus]|uniref:Uncharacterized protein n=1 Tax=Araneus ventricosus TaxID=182803 RepID=A0A4Y2CC35_ARAVE|nr:hypothetical protein AVEN_170339-1 [Araneus ventricosus]
MWVCSKLVLKSWCEIRHDIFTANLFCNRGVKFVMTSSQQTCFVSGLVDYALLPCRKFTAKLPHQICHDKLITRKIKFAASVHAIWGTSEEKAQRESTPFLSQTGTGSRRYDEDLHRTVARALEFLTFAAWFLVSFFFYLFSL